MFSITYRQEGNKVRVVGFNPLDPINDFNDVITFDTEKDAKGFCLTINTIDSAIRLDYSGVYAICWDGDVLGITTETQLTFNKENSIKQRIQMIIDIMPISKHICIKAL